MKAEVNSLSEDKEKDGLKVDTLKRSTSGEVNQTESLRDIRKIIDLSEICSNNVVKDKKLK